ncbi:MAG: hypothetical protein V1929_04005 [bacterium]
MKYLAAFLIVCLVVLGLPAAAPAQVVTSDGGGQSDNSGDSEASNLSFVLLVVVVAVVLGAGVYANSSRNSIARAKDSPVLLVARTDSEDDIVYEPGDIFSAGLAYHAEF